MIRNVRKLEQNGPRRQLTVSRRCVWGLKPWRWSGRNRHRRRPAAVVESAAARCSTDPPGPAMSTTANQVPPGGLRVRNQGTTTVLCARPGTRRFVVGARPTGSTRRCLAKLFIRAVALHPVLGQHMVPFTAGLRLDRFLDQGAQPPYRSSWQPSGPLTTAGNAKLPSRVVIPASKSLCECVGHARLQTSCACPLRTIVANPFGR